MRKRDHLHGYQLKAIDWIMLKKRCALFLKMGAGKTASTLTAVVDVLDCCAAKKVLIIAPLRVANSVWMQEANDWEHTVHLKIVKCTGSEKSRIAALQTPADVYTINRENVKWLVDFYLYGKKWPFDFVVIDESSSFKNPTSQRFKMLKKALPKTEYMVLLTGTPSPNGLLDLWSQLYLIDFGERLGRTMTMFKKRWFESDYMGYNLTPKVGADKEIHAAIDDVCLHIDNTIEVPRIDIIERVELPPATLKKYQQFEKELLAEFEGEEIEAMNAAVLANKLLQFCNGFLYTDENHNYVELHDKKVKALKEIVDDNPTENMLVAYNFKVDLERLKKQFPEAVVLDKEQETIDKWNSGEIKMLLAHPASAGHGLNLQSGGSIIVWFGLNWSLELYQQFNARLARQGQQNTVRVVHIVADGCIDERVLLALKDKNATQKSLLHALKK